MGSRRSRIVPPVFREGLENLPWPDPHGVEFRLRLNIGSIHQQNGHLEEARAEYDSALSTAVRPESHLARLYLDIATIAREKLGDQTRMAWAASNVLSVERALGAADRQEQSSSGTVSAIAVDSSSPRWELTTRSHGFRPGNLGDVRSGVKRLDRPSGDAPAGTAPHRVVTLDIGSRPPHAVSDSSPRIFDSRTTTPPRRLDMAVEFRPHTPCSGVA